MAQRGGGGWLGEMWEMDCGGGKVRGGSVGGGGESAFYTGSKDQKLD